MRTQRYKNIERHFTTRVLHLFSSAAHKVWSAVAGILHALDSRMTIMIIPHSQGKSYSIETNVAAMALTLTLAVGVSVSFAYFVHGAAEGQVQIARLTEHGRDTQARLDELRDANVNLLQTAAKFQTAFTQSISALGISVPQQEAAKSDGTGGDLASLFNVKEESQAMAVQETEGVRQLSDFLENSIEPVEQFGKMFDSRALLFREIPSIWPVSNPNAHISMAFGPNVHPITGQWYVHKGLDFSTFRSGDRVVATADGYVIAVGYDLSFGNYVILKHKHGIYTRYAHMMYSTVKKGQYVTQRDLIGYVGNTGVTTGPHLHYEIHIGSDVVDPARYINVKLFK